MASKKHMNKATNRLGFYFMKKTYLNKYIDMRHAALVILVLICVLIFSFTELVQKYLNWNERSKGVLLVKRICGVFVILGGFYMVFITL